MQNIPFHPLADIFPLMHGQEFVDLKMDIKANGLHEPVILLDGQILDGRNRFRACQETGVKADFVEYNGPDPASYVISLNLIRRHLNESQRGMAAAKLSNMQQGARTDIKPAANLQEVSRANAAELLNVSERTVNTAKKVERQGAPELVQAVEHGEVSVSAAAEIAELPQEEQTEVIARGEKEILQRAKEIKQQKKFSTLMSSETPEHYTPEIIINTVRELFGQIDTDPCSNSKQSPNIPAITHFTKEDDGLNQQWIGRVYMNPPYGKEIAAWVEKLVSEIQSGNCTEAIALVPARTDTKWFSQLRNGLCCFVRGRLTFIGNDDPAPFPSAVIYLGENNDKFISSFSPLGDIWSRVNG